MGKVPKKKPAAKQAGSVGKPKARRAPRGTGEDRIVAAAAKYFADNGFRAPTRELARRLGVTQALLYRYFPSKQALIDKVFETIFIGNWDPSRTERLLDRTQPIEARLTQFYTEMAGRSTPVRSRLFMRANLDDQRLAERYTFSLNDRTLTPAITALRQSMGLASPGRKPILRAERELVMTLHSSVVFLNIRKNIYGSPLPDDLGDHIAFYVACFLAGAREIMPMLHKKHQPSYLAQRIGGRKGTPIE